MLAAQLEPFLGRMRNKRFSLEEDGKYFHVVIKLSSYEQPNSKQCSMHAREKFEIIDEDLEATSIH